MSKIILVSNRLAVSAQEDEEGSFTFTPSMGGLATGLSSLHAQEDSLWVGWSGIPSDTISPEKSEDVKKTLRNEFKSVPVDLSTGELEKFYYGFCNDTIWPLFHYFPTYTKYENELWNSYRRVNEKFAEVLKDVVEDDDFIWIHDYHLMLLPRMVKELFPRSRIGYFLHIPFPSYELFRLLPWREELLEGLLGADLVGFHTFGYARHFLSSVGRILGAEHHLGTVKHDNRMIRVDTFPMGIDYQKYAGATRKEEIQREIQKVEEEIDDYRLILSVDRLDYSKGIPLRLKAYHRFLVTHPEYHEKVQLVMIVAPSRIQVQHYQELKREIDELVSIINSTFGTIGWNPVSYFYRAFQFDQLTALYARAEVLLVTPIRDGMNLISKEYLAVHEGKGGAVVLSETAGSARELGEALTVNPNDIDDIAEAIRAALEMPLDEQKEKNKRMNERLARYDIHYWAHDFMDKLKAVAELQESFLMKHLSSRIRERMLEDFRNSGKRLLLIDYDGTLVSYGERPGVLDLETHRALKALAADPRNEIVIISGRDKEFIRKSLDGLPVNIVAGHGIWIREKQGEWETLETLTGDWKDDILPILELYRVRTPGASVEVNEYSLKWHYRKAQPELVAVRLSELKDALYGLTLNLNLSILEGNKVLEIKDSRVSKGRAVSHWLGRQNWDFIMAIGDDWTDEDVFSALPETAYSIKVGVDISSARFFLDSVRDVRALIRTLPEV